MMDGLWKILKLCADNWDTKHMVVILMLCFIS